MLGSTHLCAAGVMGTKLCRTAPVRRCGSRPRRASSHPGHRESLVDAPLRRIVDLLGRRGLARSLNASVFGFQPAMVPSSVAKMKRSPLKSTVPGVRRDRSEVEHDACRGRRDPRLGPGGRRDRHHLGKRDREVGLVQRREAHAVVRDPGDAGRAQRETPRVHEVRIDLRGRAVDAPDPASAVSAKRNVVSTLWRIGAATRCTAASCAPASCAPASDSPLKICAVGGVPPPARRARIDGGGHRRRRDHSARGTDGSDDALSGDAFLVSVHVNLSPQRSYGRAITARRDAPIWQGS